MRKSIRIRTGDEALQAIVDAWDLVASGRPDAAGEIVPQCVADNWAASIAEFARKSLAEIPRRFDGDELRQYLQRHVQTQGQIDPSEPMSVVIAPIKTTNALEVTVERGRLTVSEWQRQ